METINIPDKVPVSLKKMVKYFHLKFDINININEEFIKNILDGNHTYHLYKKGKNKNNVRFIKKRKKEIVENTKICIDKEKYVSENDDTFINIYGSKNVNCKRCPKIMLKYAVERIINLKYLSNNIYLYKGINDKINSYKSLENSFLVLIDSYRNSCNIIWNIKINLDSLYKKLCEYKQFNNKEIKINIIEYELMLKKIIKITPTNNFINILCGKS